MKQNKTRPRLAASHLPLLAVVLMMTLLSLAGCGKKGPLQPPQSAPAVPILKPAPAAATASTVANSNSQDK